MQPTHTYEVRPCNDKRCVDLISDVLPFGGLRYGEPHEVANAIGYANFFIRSHAAVIRVSAVSLERILGGYDTAKIASPLEVIRKIMKNKLMLLFHRFVPSKRNAGANRERDDMPVPQPQFEWPYVMNSSIPILGPTYRVRR